MKSISIKANPNRVKWFMKEAIQISRSGEVMLQNFWRILLVRFLPTMLLIGSGFFSVESFAAGTWCIEDPLNPPCGGALGRCTKNLDRSLGGFVADTANVQSSRVLFERRNVPVIRRFAQICDYAQVSGNILIPNRALISGTTRINEYSYADFDWTSTGARVANTIEQLARADRERALRKFLNHSNAEVRREAHELLKQPDGPATGNGIGRIYGIIASSIQSNRDEYDIDQRAQADRERTLRGFLNHPNFEARREAQILLNQPDGPARANGIGRIYREINRTGSFSAPEVTNVASDLPDLFLSTFDSGQRAGQKGKPNAVYREYLNSEAKVLEDAHSVRLQNGTWLDSVWLNNQEVGIQEADIPSARTKTFVIHDDELARQTGLHVGDSLSQEQIQSHLKVEQLIAALTSSRLIGVKSEALNPVYNSRKLSVEEQNYIDYLRSEIKNRLDGLNEAHGGYYLNPKQVPGLVLVNCNNVEKSNGQYHSDKFKMLLESIKHNDQKYFVENVVTLATLFDKDHRESKSAFTDAFTVLFVTKNFPSEGIRQNYYHFILRCGHIH
jgi:hypothetical protein